MSKYLKCYISTTKRDKNDIKYVTESLNPTDYIDVYIFFITCNIKKLCMFVYGMYFQEIKHFSSFLDISKIMSNMI